MRKRWTHWKLPSAQRTQQTGIYLQLNFQTVIFYDKTFFTDNRFRIFSRALIGALPHCLITN